MMLRTAIFRTLGALAVIVATATTGCAVAGHPQPEQPDLSGLDVGTHGVDILAEPAEGSERYGRVIESVRMGEAVIDPAEVDPDLSYALGTVRASPLPTPVKTNGLLAAPARAVLQRYGMVAGFVVGGADRDVSSIPVVGSGRMMTLLLLRLPDADAARQAAQEIDAIDAAVSPDNVGVDIDRHPSAHAHWRPAVPTLAATMADGPFVISLLIGHTSPDRDAMVALVADTFDAQLARLRDFQPTPRDEIARLPLDRDGMLARMVPEKPGQWQYPAAISVSTVETAGWNSAVIPKGVVFGPRAAYLRIGRASEHGPAGEPLELLGFNGGNDSLGRFADAATARRDFDAFAGEAEIPGYGPIATPEGIPDVRCVQYLSAGPQWPRYSCRLLHGRYQAFLRGRTVESTHQRVAAQYALLVSAE
ncbi:DUF7373 family lipoprotein [Nocardia cyriacigeorgica]|uniref:DUF7373 family lipoprotein n=1 Tax=Nocardia cyriacigeorgica TaxID=135487 RepID=UPI0018938233|nr:hypothetical protein [Nocardia cyriacigeorgica]MBF6455781.1 hypothetical protein [Nocardia cyriacigeorgica]MBF6477475.1 hypothetical protein [Nocardia cyriacigeorgica]MBF6553478.1 hypothetical protein [Nocardia cyriacigeorgica]